MATSTADPHTLTILKVPRPVRGSLSLAKVFELDDKSKLVRVDYSAGKYFEVAQKRCETIAEWAAFHRQMAQVPFACVVRGEPIPGINPEKAQRTITNFPDAPRCWLLVDFDKPDLPRGEAGADHARRLLPPAFHAAPCFWQRSGSYGVDYEGRKGDPWRTRMRLGFMLDRPLDAPRLKRWLRHHQCDLAIYTPNQITYTADPIFRAGAIDPVQAAGEPRHGTLDIDDALVDTVIVPDEIYDWVPSFDGVSVTSRPATIDARTHEKLMEEARTCDAAEGERHGTVARWTFDAFALGMDEAEIVATAAGTLERLGRPAKEAKAEAARLVVGAQSALADNRLTISSYLVPAKDFTAVSDPNDPNLSAQPLTPAQAQAQAAALINWWDRLKVTPSTGAIKNSLDNAAIILANHSTFKDDTGACILAYDAFQDRAVWTSPPPWWRSRPEQSRPAIGDLGVPVNMDDDAVALSIWLGHLDPNSGPEGTPIHMGAQTLAQAINHVARYRTVNPARAWLDRCAEQWDGVERLATVLRDVCHSSTDQNLLSKWFPKWMMQGVARVYNPGSKCDAVLVFTGGQGAKKSTFLRNLCPYPDWFLDAMPDLRDKDAMQILRGKLIVELSEMFSAKKDVDFLKGFITKQDDTYRKSFGIDDHRRPRTVIFAGSSNDDDCLTDTGGRRWWMVRVPDTERGGKRIALDRVVAERDQWWGEAVHRYRKGEEWWLDYASELESRKVALSHSAGMEMSHDVAQWLNRPADKGGPRHPDIVRAVDIWCGPLCHPVASFTPASGRMIKPIMEGITDWVPIRFTPPGMPTIRAYVRKGSQMELDFRHRNQYFTQHQTTSPASVDFASGPTAA